MEKHRDEGTQNRNACIKVVFFSYAFDVIGTKKVLKVVKEEDRLWNAGDIIHLER